MSTSLANAIRTAIAHGNTVANINVARWSETYGNCGVERVRIVWEAIQSEMSLKPTNSFQEPEGK